MGEDPHWERLVNYDEIYPDFTINDGKFHHN